MPITVSGPGPSDIPAMKVAVEQELVDFEAFFMRPVSGGGAGNLDPLLPLEKALLRTYLLARLSGRFSPPEGS
jgi:hypothetical protein